MTCVKGRIDPSNTTKLRLFADSGGYCSNPSCLTEIFIDLDSTAVHVGEIAHVISAGDSGPRSDSQTTPEQRSQYENLILLCPRCHTIIDKAEEEYPADLLLSWKRNHRQVIADAFGSRTYGSRQEARKALELLLQENRYIFQEYGPMTEERFNPESTMPRQWLRKIRTKIIPNNRKILNLCDVNRCHLTSEECSVLEAFRQHVDDFEAKHLAGVEENGRQFPAGLAAILV
jgi:hypothetical protein